jgi:hypothetical protein
MCFFTTYSACCLTGSLWASIKVTLIFNEPKCFVYCRGITGQGIYDYKKQLALLSVIQKKRRSINLIFFLHRFKSLARNKNVLLLKMIFYYETAFFPSELKMAKHYNKYGPLLNSSIILIEG